MISDSQLLVGNTPVLSGMLFCVLSLARRLLSVSSGSYGFVFVDVRFQETCSIMRFCF